MRNVFWSGNTKRKDKLKDLAVDGWKIKCIKLNIRGTRFGGLN